MKDDYVTNSRYFNYALSPKNVGRMYLSSVGVEGLNPCNVLARKSRQPGSGQNYMGQISAFPITPTLLGKQLLFQLERPNPHAMLLELDHSV